MLALPQGGRMTLVEKIAAAKQQIAMRDGPNARITHPSPDQMCIHLGKPSSTKGCGPRLFECKKLGGLTARFIKCTKADHHCATCKSREEFQEPLMTPVVESKIIKEWNETNLYPQLPGKRFNPSILEWEDGYVFVWRDGWAGSNIWICRLNQKFAPISQAKKLLLTHRNAGYGREDPRLFVFDGKLHVSFIGVQGFRGRVSQTHQLYARLSDNFDTEKVFCPKWPGVDPKRWQKNVLFHAVGGDLYAIYGFSPLRAAKLNGERAEWVSEAPGVPWIGGELRGGASPVRVGDELWCFVHDKCGRPERYRTNLVTITPEPPFRALRYIPGPILVADFKTKPRDQYVACVFTCGAVKVGDKWVLSSGIHDRTTALHEFRHDDLESALVVAGFNARFVPSRDA